MTPSQKTAIKNIKHTIESDYYAQPQHSERITTGYKGVVYYFVMIGHGDTDDVKYHAVIGKRGQIKRIGGNND